MINVHDILETVDMIREQNLDIRTVTMGISLFDCISDDKDRLKVKIFDKVTRSAKNLVSVCEELERMYGIPIVNKRISITPLSYIGAGLSPEGFVELAEVLEAAAEELGLPNVWARALPGRLTPRTAAGAIRDAVSHILLEK